MSTRILATEFMPAERVPIDVVHRQQAAVEQSPIARELLDSVGHGVFILNVQRQIVYASRPVQGLLQNRSLELIVGLRPGEALDCLHAHDMEAGCGTSVSCEECGAAQAILAALAGQKPSIQCRVTRLINLTPSPQDFLIHTLPFQHEGEKYLLFAIEQSHPGGA